MTGYPDQNRNINKKTKNDEKQAWLGQAAHAALNA